MQRLMTFKYPGCQDQIITMLDNAGANETAIKRILGHASQGVTIKRSVEHCFLVCSSFRLKMIEFIVPVRSGGFCQFFKAFSGSFGM